VTPPGTSPVGAPAVLECKLLRLTGSLTADAEVVVPNNRKPYFVHNAAAGGFAVTVSPRFVRNPTAPIGEGEPS
jgi:hypothetical protein